MLINKIKLCLHCIILTSMCFILDVQVTYYVVDSDRNEGKDYFEINRESGEIFTKVVFDREKQGAYALEVEARDGASSARPNGNGQPNSGMYCLISLLVYTYLNSFLLIFPLCCRFLRPRAKHRL